MADITSNIGINIDASGALASLQALQKQISAFHTSMAKSGELSNNQLRNMQQNLVNNINATGQFSASIQRVKTSAESFTSALEKNKLTMGQYFNYAMGSTKTFGRMFSTEMATIDKVARERVKDLQTQYIKLGRDATGAMQAIAVRPNVLDMKDLGTQTAIAAQKHQLFNQLITQGSTNLLNFGKNTQWAGRQLMVGFTIPLGIMGAMAAKEFQKIEEQVLRLERVYGDFNTTVADTEAATKGIRELATEFTKYGIAVEKTIGLAADAAAMGQTGAALMAQVAEATRLAALGGVTQQQALETTISLTSAFGVATEDLAKKTNFLNAVENQTITSIADLTEAIPKAGPVIQQLGGNVEDLTFFLTAMREGGINASESANALKSGLASLINPTQEAADMLAGFGININQIVQGNAGNVKQIVIDFAAALDQLDPLNRAQAIEQLFGKFQFSRLSTLFQNVIAEGTQASRVLQLTQSSAAELAALSERELGKLEASPLYQFQGAIERFKAALAPVGEEFMKAVTPLINFGTDLLNTFNNWGDGAKQFAVITTAAIAGIGPIALMSFGLIANGVANIIKAANFLRNAFRGVDNQSNLLTNQLNYMNSEQIEAATVAAALDQVHNNLIQTFNVEAGALRNLAGAYGSAIAQQAGFMAGPVATGRGGVTARGARNMATGGIIRGPGTGTSDSIPAMLSNGEAVIPAATVKKYPAMVNGLVAGNIPGFAKGRTRGKPGVVASHLDIFTPARLGQTIKEVENELGDFESVMYNMSETVDKAGLVVERTQGRLVDLVKENTSVMAGGKAFPGTAVAGMYGRNSLLESAGLGGEAFEIDTLVAQGEQLQQKVAAGIIDPAKYGGEVERLLAESEEARTLLSQSNDQTKTRIDYMRGVTKETTAQALMQTEKLSEGEAYLEAERRLTQIDNKIAAIRQSGISDEKAFATARRELIAHNLKLNNEYVQGDPSSVRHGELRSEASAKGYSTAKTKNASAGKYRKVVDRVGYLPGQRQSPSEGVSSAVLANFRTTGEHVASNIIAEMQDGIKDSLDTMPADPEIRQKTDKAVNTIGRTVATGLDNSQAVIRDAGQRAGQAMADAVFNTNPAFGAVAAGTPPVRASMQQYSQGLLNKVLPGYMAMGGLERTIAQYGSVPKIDSPAMRPGVKLLETSQMLRPMNLLNAAMKSASGTISTASVAMKNFGTSAANLAQRAGSAIVASVQNFGDRVATVAAQVTTATKNMATRVGGFLNRTMGRTGGAAMGIGMAGSMGGMFLGGEAGQVVSNIGMGAFAVGGLMEVIAIFRQLPPIAQAVIGAVALAAAGIGATVAIVSASMDAERRERQKLTDAMGDTTEKTNALAESMNKVTAAQEAFEQQQTRAEAVGATAQGIRQVAEGGKYLETKPGKGLITSAETLIDKEGVAAAAEQIAQQLSDAIIQGAITPAQADSIAESLASQLDEKELAVQIRGELTEIVGSEGTDWIEKPIQAVQRLQERQAKEQMDLWQKAGGKELEMLAKQKLINEEINMLMLERDDASYLGENQKVKQIQAQIDKIRNENKELIQGDYAAGIDTEQAQRALELGYEQIQINENYHAALKKQYDQKIAQATTEEEIAQLEVAKRNALQAATAASAQQYAQMRQQTQALLAGGYETQVAESMTDTFVKRFKKGSEERTQAEGLVERRQSLAQVAEQAQGETVNIKAIISTAMGSGVIDLSTLERLTAAAESTETQDIQFVADFDAVATDQGAQFAGLMDKMLDESGYSKGEIQQAFRFMADAEASDLAKSMMDRFEASGDTQRQAFLLDFMVEVAGDKDGVEKLKRLEAQYAQIDQTIASGGPIVLEQITQIDWSGVKDMGALQSWFDSIPKEQQKFFIEQFLTVFGRLSYKEIGDYMRSQGIKGLGGAANDNYSRNFSGGRSYTTDQYDQYRGAAAAAQAQSITNALAAEGRFAGSESSGASAPPAPSGGGGGGGGGGGAQEPEKPPTSFIDDIVSQVRRVVVAGQNMTENFQDSWNAIGRLFGSGAPPIFSGIEQQLRNLGAGPDFIQLITGMSKEDWETYKDQMFNFDAAGNITGLKIMAESISRALNTVKLGEFNSQQQEAIRNASNQSVAIQKLVSLGSSYANAYSAVEDAAIAAAIAQETNIDKLKELMRLAMEAKRVTEVAGAASSLVTGSTEKQNMANTLGFLTKYSANLTDTQRAAILASKELQTLAANFEKLTPEQLRVLQQAIKDAELEAEVQINIKKQTAEGMQDLFNEGFNKAMEQFSAREQEIKISFKALKDPFQDIVDAATDTIENIRNAPGGLDDLEADLQRIQDQEVDINEKYKNRFAALDQIQKINDRIAAQQRGQLSLAEALSQGDIAAAARAAEEIRATDAAQALVDQREALQKSQELELENLIGQMGMTREQIEQRIREIKMQILDIEERQIEPAQYQLTLLQRQEEAQIGSLTVLGKTKEEWNKIKNEIELARVNTSLYNQSIFLANDLVQDLIDKWKEIEKPKETIHTIIERRVQEVTPAPTPPPVNTTPVNTTPVTTTPTQPTVDIDDLARRAIRGEFGNGQARRNALGGNYVAVQTRVNEMLGIRGVVVRAAGGLIPNYFAKGGVAKKPTIGPSVPTSNKKPDPEGTVDVELGTFHQPFRYAGGFTRYAIGGTVGTSANRNPFRIGTDTVPAMLTPGEFVVRKWAVDKFGVDNLRAINDGKFGSSSVYNYNMSVNVRSDANPDEIARTVMAQIKRVDSQRIRGNRF